MPIPINPATVDSIQQFTVTMQDMVTRTIPALQVNAMQKLDTLLVIMLIWTGIKYALGVSDNIRAELFGLISTYLFAYEMLVYYDTPIPGMSSSFHQLIPRWAGWMSATIDISSLDTLTGWGNAIVARVQKPSLWNGFELLTYLEVQGAMVLLYWLSFVITIMGYIGVAYFSVIGSQFICWLIFPPLSSLFGGWLRGMLSFAFFRVSSSVVIYLFATFLTNYLAGSLSNGDFSLGHMAYMIPQFIAFLLAFLAALLGAAGLAIMPFSGVGHIQGPMAYATAMFAARSIKR